MSSVFVLRISSGIFHSLTCQIPVKHGLYLRHWEDMGHKNKTVLILMGFITKNIMHFTQTDINHNRIFVIKALNVPIL